MRSVCADSPWWFLKHQVLLGLHNSNCGRVAFAIGPDPSKLTPGTVEEVGVSAYIGDQVANILQEISSHIFSRRSARKRYLGDQLANYLRDNFVWHLTAEGTKYLVVTFLTPLAQQKQAPMRMNISAAPCCCGCCCCCSSAASADDNSPLKRYGHACKLFGR